MNKIFLFLLSFAFVAMSCGPKHQLPEVKSLPAGQTWSGVWYSPQFEHMYLRQVGDEVRGIYAYKDGGTMEGSANGNLMTFTWLDPGNRSEARRSMKGKGFLSMTRDGDNIKLKGEWGYGEENHGGGVWTAEFVRPLDADDPRTLEELNKER